MIFVGLFLIVVLCIAILQFQKARRGRAERRNAYLVEYPTPGYVLAVIDKDRYREIRDTHGSTGFVHAVRAVMRDFPGILLGEAAEVVLKLDS